MAVLEEVLRRQHGVVTRAQALGCGLTDERIEANVRAGRWARLYPGVYAAFSGEPPRLAQLWAAVLRAGAGAMLSHESAAELVGLLDRPVSKIHVTIPHRRTVCPIPGVVVHRRVRADIAHPTRTPPQTRIEETLTDLTQGARSVADAVGWLARAVGARLTTAERLNLAMQRRGRLRWRSVLVAALADVADGCLSLLELAYRRDVERAHGLPAGERQASRPRRGGRRYDDVLYRAYRTRVELDGRVAHPVDAAFRDMRSDNDAVLAGDRPLRYGYGDVSGVPCSVASQVAIVLASGGWAGRARRCGRPSCVIP